MDVVRMYCRIRASHQTTISHMKKIICFTDSLGSGGAQRQLVGLATMLKDKGYDVDVVLYYDVPFYKYILDNAGIKCVVIANTSNPVKRIWLLYRYFIQNKYDITIAYQETPSLIACLLRPLLRWKKLIVSERNTTQTITKRDKFRFWLWRYADYVVPNSFSQANFIKNNVPQYFHKVSTITNFTDTDYFAPENSKKVRSVSNKLLVVASEKKEKNFNRFVQAIANVREYFNINVLWVGIRDEHIDEHRKILKNNNLENIFEVSTPHKNLISIINGVDYFCLPSLYEGFPNVLCEAMSCGVPVICSNVCDNPNIVEEGSNGFLFNPLDIDDMTQAIEKLLSISNEEYRNISQNNRRKALAMFSKEIFINKYVTLIES